MLAVMSEGPQIYPRATAAIHAFRNQSPYRHSPCKRLVSTGKKIGPEGPISLLISLDLSTGLHPQPPRMQQRLRVPARLLQPLEDQIQRRLECSALRMAHQALVGRIL